MLPSRRLVVIGHYWRRFLDEVSPLVSEKYPWLSMQAVFNGRQKARVSVGSVASPRKGFAPSGADSWLNNLRIETIVQQRSTGSSGPSKVFLLWKDMFPGYSPSSLLGTKKKAGPEARPRALPVSACRSWQVMCVDFSVGVRCEERGMGSSFA